MRSMPVRMKGSDISECVDRLEAGKAQVADDHKLSPSDWDEVRKLLEARRQYNMQKYVNALFAYRMKYALELEKPRRVYSEQEILAEFDPMK